VRLDRPFPHGECGSDFAIGTGFSDERGDPPLGRRQALDTRPTTDVAELRARLFDPRPRPELLEFIERRTDRVAGSALLALTSSDDTEREQRPSPSEAICGMLMLCDGVLEE
jgi:hypothetical protein